MAVKKKPVKKYFKTSNSYITVLDNNLLVMSNEIHDKAFTAIKVCKGFYIELGRSIKEFDEVLLNTRVPIMFELVTEIDGFKHYKIVRMQTGIIDDITLGTLVCNGDIITRLTCDKSYKNDEDYLKNEQIGSLWKIKIPRTDDIEANKRRAENTILSLVGALGNSGDLKIKTSYNTTKIDISIKGRGMSYVYTFILNEKTKCYELIMVTLDK